MNHSDELNLLTPLENCKYKLQFRINEQHFEMTLEEVAKLKTALDKAREALDEIIDPVKYARKRSGTVDPMRCYWMERHTGYLQTIAKKALAEIDGVLESEVKGK